MNKNKNNRRLSAGGKNRFKHGTARRITKKRARTSSVRSPHAQLVMVNLGCGNNIVASTPKERWINIDMFWKPSMNDMEKPENFVEGNVLDIPLEKNSVDYLVMDQVLEHIPMAEIVPALHEIRRVLKVGGRAVIIVPDFESAAQDWLRHNVGGTFDPLKYQYYSEVIYGNQMHAGEFHQAPMSPQYLNYALNTAGLVKKDLLMFSTNSPVPTYPGLRSYLPNARCRNAQLVADIIKTA